MWPQFPILLFLLIPRNCGVEANKDFREDFAPERTVNLR